MWCLVFASAFFFIAFVAAAPRLVSALPFSLAAQRGGWSCTTKDLVPRKPFGKEKLCPKPSADHSAPFQPSPYESVMSRVHVAPSATASGTLDAYGAPPLSVLSSEQVRLQPTSAGHEPPEQVIAEEIVDAAGGDGGCGGRGGGDSDGGGDGGAGGCEGGNGGTRPMMLSAVSSKSLKSALVRVASLKSMAGPKPPSAVSFEPLRSALVRSAALKSMTEEP